MMCFYFDYELTTMQKARISVPVSTVDNSFRIYFFVKLWMVSGEKHLIFLDTLMRFPIYSYLTL